MDKELSRLIFIKNNIKVPNYLLLQKKNKLNLNKKIDFPIVIKPINEGSSLGVSICKNKRQFMSKYKKLIKKYKKILVEKYIPGREIQVAVMGEKALGAIELVPKRQFYDYIAKYSSSARTRHIMPAPLSREKYQEVLDLAKKAHKLLGCRGITRSDFRFFKNKFYLLETNTQPGMTKLSLVPEIAKYCGINFEDLVVWMIKDASCNR
jgi:D-alanine-D-alanine ligase